MPLVTLYVARGCGLCRDAAVAVESVCEALGVSYELVSIDGDEELERRYRVSLPVLEIDGVRRFEFFVEPYDLRAALTGAENVGARHNVRRCP